jgi:hypothetical protein
LHGGLGSREVLSPQWQEQLTSLAPDIVESILAGQSFADISLQHCRKGIPVFWEEQRRVLKSTAAHDLEAVANQ